MDILDNKDQEATQILYNLEIEGRKIDAITDYINEMKKIRDIIINYSINKEYFDKNISLIKNNLYELGSLYFCFHINIKKSVIKYNENSIISHYLTGLSAVPGGHDFNVMLGRYFTYELFQDFYLKWIDCINIFLESNATLYPRFFIEIVKTKNSYYISKDVLVTKQDLGYNIPKNLTYKTKEERIKILEYEKTWKYNNCRLPKYYPFISNLPSKEDYWNLFCKSIEDEKQCKDRFESFISNQYCILEFLKNNIKKFENLDNVKILDL